MARNVVRLAVAASALCARPASAHVKWFCATVDVREVPVELGLVLTPTFAIVAAGFMVLIFVGYLIDRTIGQRWPRLATSGSRNAVFEEIVIRVAVCAYFLLLWDDSAVVLWRAGNAILTPELTAELGWMRAVQFGVAAAVLWRPTCIVAALGIMALYADGIRAYGIFHMTDYVFFPGIAAYLALSTIALPPALRVRETILSGSLAFGLMWTAIEKFVYPQWTLSVIEQHPDLAFGFPPGFVTVVAGFVEFTLAFYVMTGRGLVRFGALAYAVIFLAAMPEFGQLDLVGHLPIIAILAVVCLHGASPLPRLLGTVRSTGFGSAAATLSVYLTAMALFFGLYYGLHRIEYGV